MYDTDNTDKYQTNFWNLDMISNINFIVTSKNYFFTSKNFIIIFDL